MTKREVDTAQQSQVDKIKARWPWLTEDIDNDIEYDGHYVEDFEEGYAEDFEEERNVEVFKQEKKEQKTIFLPFTRIKLPPLTSIKLPPLTSEQPMGASSDHIYYIKPIPVFGEAEHP
jgi:hypothetical protein